MLPKHKIVVGVTGASGAIYAQQLFSKLEQYHEQISKLGVVFSKNAEDIWQHELGNKDYKYLSFDMYERDSYDAPFASGSARYNTMIICPCSMGTMGRIANGVSDDLITRAADVILKERRKLILVLRDTPYSLIHIENMHKITLAGGIICPASPSFYSKPETIQSAVNTVIDRVLDLAGLDIETHRWKE